MATKLILKFDFLARQAVQLYVVVSSYGKRSVVAREGVIRNRVVEEVVNFGRRHIDYVGFCLERKQRRSSLLLLGQYDGLAL